jgi:hypothetical protein
MTTLILVLLMFVMPFTIGLVAALGMHVYRRRGNKQPERFLPRWVSSTYVSPAPVVAESRPTPEQLGVRQL